MKPAKIVFLILIAILFYVSFTIGQNLAQERIDNRYGLQVEALEAEIEVLRGATEGRGLLLEEIRELKRENRQLKDRMDKWLDEWEVMEAEVTGYAPLDPQAVEGWDYWGDPNITKSGQQVIPGKTAAGPEDFNFGTRVYFIGDGFDDGFREINDRGGLVGYNDAGLPQFDLAVKTKAEANIIGRRRVKVVVSR